MLGWIGALILLVVVVPVVVVLLKGVLDAARSFDDYAADQEPLAAWSRI